MKRKIDIWTEELLQKVNGYPRIVGYRNLLDWCAVKKHKGTVILELSIFSLNNHGKKITLKEMGFDSKNCYRKHAIEQFEIVLSKNQAKVLLGELKAKIKGARK